MIPAGVAAAVIILSGATFTAFAQVSRRRAVARRGASRRVAPAAVQLVAYFFWVPYVVVALRPGPELPVPVVVGAAGLLVTALGVVLAVWAIAKLGRHYDLILEIHAGHELVRTGPFGWVRHPVYTGLAVHFIGACAATGDLVLVAGTLLVTLPALYARARTEEALLRSEFGAEYDRYAAQVPMLVPGFPR